VPLVSRSGKAPADQIGKALPELQGPLPHGRMTDLNAAGGEHLLHHAQAEWKAEIQSNSVTDHFGGKTVAGIARMARRFHPSRMAPCSHLPVNLTVPLEASISTGINPSVSSACLLSG
jgi:hypothetical protein